MVRNISVRYIRTLLPSEKLTCASYRIQCKKEYVYTAFKLYNRFIFKLYLQVFMPNSSIYTSCLFDSPLSKLSSFKSFLMFRVFKKCHVSKHCQFQTSLPRFVADGYLCVYNVCVCVNGNWLPYPFRIHLL